MRGGLLLYCPNSNSKLVLSNIWILSLTFNLFLYFKFDYLIIFFPYMKRCTSIQFGEHLFLICFSFQNRGDHYLKKKKSIFTLLLYQTENYGLIYINKSFPKFSKISETQNLTGYFSSGFFVCTFKILYKIKWFKTVQKQINGYLTFKS